MYENNNLELNNETKGENSFMKKLFKKRLNQKGLTLIELLAVIVILAIVAAIAIPAIGNLINNSRDKAVLADASTVLSSAKIAVSDGSCVTTTNGSNQEVVTCNKATLAPYVEGITLTDGDQAVRTDGVWTVTFDKLKTIKNTTKFTVTAATGVDAWTPAADNKVITESSLKAAMNQ